MLWLPGRLRLAGVGLLVAALAVASLPWWQVPNPNAVLRLARSADVLAFQENTPDFVRALEAKGLGRDFSYRQGTALCDSDGTMIWSRAPLAVADFGTTEYTSLVVRTTVHGIPWTR